MAFDRMTGVSNNVFPIQDEAGSYTKHPGPDMSVWCGSGSGAGPQPLQSGDVCYVVDTPAGNVRVSCDAVFSKKKGMPCHAQILATCY